MTELPKRLEKKIMPVTESGCWIWMACIDQKGYGLAWGRGKYERAHRMIYEMLKESIPKGMTLDHLCRVRCCVNPDHLEVVSMRENWSRGIAPTVSNAKKRTCNYGHPLTGTNLYIEKKTNGRRCRICSNQKTKNWKQLRRAWKKGKLF